MNIFTTFLKHLLHPRPAHLRLGALGEKLSRRALIELGWDILAHNYRCPQGEIDIVAREDNILCFVEVKTRHYREQSRPADAVDQERERRLIKAASHYRKHANRDAHFRWRFDIIEVYFDQSRLIGINLIREAFGDRTT